MKIELQKGCTGEWLEINNEVPTEELMKSAVLEIVRAEARAYNSWQPVLSYLMERFGDCEMDSTPCDQCGNWGETITLVL